MCSIIGSQSFGQKVPKCLFRGLTEVSANAVCFYRTAQGVGFQPAASACRLKFVLVMKG